VIQGDYKAEALSPKHLQSNYRSKSNANCSSLLEFKFSINGKDNELDYNRNHQANIYTAKNGEVVLDLIFGEQRKQPENEKKERFLEENTKVKFSLDMSSVLKAFSTQGFYVDVHGEKIYESDFKGVFIAGSSFPLNWDFENLASNSKSELKDQDGDGVFECELVFNTFNPDVHTSNEWILAHDLSNYPEFTCGNELLNAIYNLSLDEVILNIESDGTFRTGEKWAGVWTRDISYSVLLSLALIEPEIARVSLMKKVKNDRIIQDTGTGGAWPVSSDRVVWTLAAWEIYKNTGDKKWLAKAHQIIENSVKDDFKTLVDKKTGLMKGESSFLDWRKQTYPLWMEPVDIASSLNLGTNAVYYQALITLNEMSKELGLDEKWTASAETVKQGINKWLWSKDENFYGQYLYGRMHQSLSPRSEALGEAFCILFDVADERQKEELLQHVPLLSYGIPCIYPQIPNISPYHNNGIWPFVQAFWTLAGKQEKHSKMVEFGLGSMLRQAGLFLTNKENMVAEDGDFAGTVLNSDRQLWSVAGQLAMTYRILFGMNMHADKLTFSPLVPKSFAGTYNLNQFKYRGAVLDISVEGYGDGIASFIVDGEEKPDFEIAADSKGHHRIEIVLNSTTDKKKVNLLKNITSPETPVLVYEGSQLEWTKSKKAVAYQIHKNGNLWKTQKENKILLSDDEELNEYQVSAIDETGVTSFLSNPVHRVNSGNEITIQCEQKASSVDQQASGYHGDGYVLLEKIKNTSLSLSHNVKKPGAYQIKFRYANGSGSINTDNKCAIRSLYVNGQFIASLVFPQRGKDEWSNWGYTPNQCIFLRKGENKFSLKLEAWNENMNGEVNSCLIDEIILVPM